MGRLNSQARKLLKDILPAGAGEKKRAGGRALRYYQNSELNLAKPSGITMLGRAFRTPFRAVWTAFLPRYIKGAITLSSAPRSRVAGFSFLAERSVTRSHSRSVALKSASISRMQGASRSSTPHSKWCERLR